MSLAGSGYNNNHALGVMYDSKDSDGYGIVLKMTEITIDVKNISCVAPGYAHTVVLTAGDDRDFTMGSLYRTIFKEFTEIKISEEKIIWAAAGNAFTLYLTESGSIVLCSEKAKGERINISLTKRTIYVFAGIEYGAIIDEDGSVYILDKEDSHSIPDKFSFPSPAIEVVCCVYFTVVLLSNY